MPAKTGGEKVVTTNRKAYHDYFVEEEIEAGVVLHGSEIKSIRQGRVNLRDAYARIENGELWLVGAHISPYEHSGTYFNHEPDRPRKLLIHHRELDYLRNKVEASGYTLVPVRMVLRNGRAKVDIALAKGKKLYDKRAALAERDAKRTIERELRERG
ncbi:MAG TPA: SsrA-binding protein SmpB [Nitrolancea sp.]|jgi:SsrA-binding protein|nr:SsrA-binding protein SmpB [Nitrolancea sp.]